MRLYRLLTVIGTAGVLAFSVPFNAMAQVEKPGDMDETTWARLQDNVLEYDEISDLVENYNPAYRQFFEQIDMNAQIFRDAAEELRNAADEAQSEAKDVKDYNQVMYSTLQGAAKGYRQAAKRFDKAVDSVFNNLEVRHNLSRIKKATTSGIQQMMIGYYQALASKELVETAAELAQAAYDSTVTQFAIGMATATDVQAAEKSLQGAKAQQQALENSLNSLLHQMRMMTGWSYDADMVLGEVPEPDLARIATMNPANDLERAIGNNYTLISLRSMSGKSTVSRNIKFGLMDDAEGKVKVELESLYQSILEGKTAYEAAVTAFQAAQITMDGNELKNQMGMLGRLEYLQLKVAYLQQKAALTTAALNLRQDMENYDWAVQGLADVG